MGVLAGMIIELSIDAQTIADLKEHNHKLTLENQQLRKQPEVIEIIDRRAEGQEIDYSQKW